MQMKEIIILFLIVIRMIGTKNCEKGYFCNDSKNPNLKFPCQPGYYCPEN